ncbi:MAG: ATP-dependent protease LonB [Oscillospiraceae bacterium]|nr:ATP-dependent protease LonB [Oscillospiraceae bacterium]
MTVLMFAQFGVSVIVGLYFFGQLRNKNQARNSIESDSKRELDKLKRLNEIKLTAPLSEKTRPTEFSDIIGQEDGLKALTAALCGPNPQHVLIYGPPGVGKTAAARVVLEEAKKAAQSPFKSDAKFIEADATIMRFDERSIADPLIGSVHDPIYQGAGAYGSAGVPQPKPGMVTKAHGGVLFIDEIGELHPTQMNKLLKVLEDRKVTFESAYYAGGDRSIPPHIHHVFQKGMPADFRLVGATTKNPEDIPPALRSRCVEIFFRNLHTAEIQTIAKNAARQGGFVISDTDAALVAKYSHNGRDAVNIVQTSASVAATSGMPSIIRAEDIEFVLKAGKHSPRLAPKLNDGKNFGVVNGLAVTGSVGTVLNIEAVAEKTIPTRGTLTVTGIVDEQELAARGQKLKGQSFVRSSIYNMLTILQKRYGINPKDYNIHINFPNSAPVDGPSAGIAILCAVYSAITKIPVDNYLAMTGEISIKGKICAVGGVSEKIDAAVLAGARRVIIPQDNWQQRYENMGVDVVAVTDIAEVMRMVFGVAEKVAASQNKRDNHEILINY